MQIVNIIQTVFYLACLCEFIHIRNCVFMQACATLDKKTRKIYNCVVFGITVIFVINAFILNFPLLAKDLTATEQSLVSDARLACVFAEARRLTCLHFTLIIRNT